MTDITTPDSEDALRFLNFLRAEHVLLPMDWEQFTRTEQQRGIAFARYRDVATPPIADMGGDLPTDVRRLVVAARYVTDHEGHLDAEHSKLLDAVEVFSSRVPYDDEPEPIAPATGGTFADGVEAADASYR